jgi:hypothetical protein
MLPARRKVAKQLPVTVVVADVWHSEVKTNGPGGFVSRRAQYMPQCVELRRWSVVAGGTMGRCGAPS